MSNYSKLYWLTRLDAIHSLMVGIIIFSSIALIIYLLFYLIEGSVNELDEDERKDFVKIYGIAKRLSMCFLIPSILIVMFVPSKNEAILIMAGGKVLNFAQQDTSLSKIPAQTTAIISSYMDEQIKKLKTNK